MNAENLKNILKDALANGNHGPDCVFRKSLSCLPSRHPKHTEPLSLSACDCWKKKATRLLRALGSVERTEWFSHD
jgi:hypothetical protein